jgi:imidazolonepropionase-like amidohydrolase
MPDIKERIVFRNASVLDVQRGELLPDQNVLVDGDRLVEVGGSDVKSKDARIDCHVHVNAVTADLSALAEWSPAYVTARAARVMRGMLRRGFTTVRDVAGADFGLAAAVDEGHLEGPRLIFGGKALSQTGGHADWRGRGRTAYDSGYCCPALGTICDGVAEVRRAAREEIRRGAHHIKVMLSGGVASPTDRVDSIQFSLEEIRAAVEEAEAASLYVTGHAYTSPAINRGLECGVRSIEHGNLMDDSSVRLLKEKDAFYVPTLATYSALAARGKEFGLPEHSHKKVFDVLDSGLHALELAHRAGVRIAYGTDLLGGMHEDQLTEFTIRSEVQKPIDILRSATTLAASLLRMEGRVGTIRAGAFADLLVVDANPLDEISVLTAPEKHLKYVMAAGRIVKDVLTVT